MKDFISFKEKPILLPRTLKGRKFFDCYFRPRSYVGTTAAVEAGYSPRSARTMAWKLKKNYQDYYNFRVETIHYGTGNTN